MIYKILKMVKSPIFQQNSDFSPFSIDKHLITDYNNMACRSRQVYVLSLIVR